MEPNFEPTDVSKTKVMSHSWFWVVLTHRGPWNVTYSTTDHLASEMLHNHDAESLACHNFCASCSVMWHILRPTSSFDLFFFVGLILMFWAVIVSSTPRSGGSSFSSRGLSRSKDGVTWKTENVSCFAFWRCSFKNSLALASQRKKGVTTFSFR